MIITENIHSAKTHFSKLINKALSGDEVIIARAGKPLVKLVPVGAGEETCRIPGSAKGKIIINPDFDSSMSEEELSDWGL